MSDPQMPASAPEQAPSAPPPPTQPATAPAAPAAPAAATPLPGSALVKSLSRAELFIAGGAALILLADLVFVIIMRAYGGSTITWIAAAVSLILILSNGRVGELTLSSATYKTALLVLGALALLGGFRDLIYDIVILPGRTVDVSYLLGALGLYVGVALMAFGAWQLWKGRAG
jgi:hypothetical protein